MEYKHHMVEAKFFKPDIKVMGEANVVRLIEEMEKEIEQLKNKVEALQDGEVPDGMICCRFCGGTGLVDDI